MKLNEALGMRSVGDVAELSGVTVRTLHHYDAIGLLAPSGRSRARYRLYDAADLARLQEILLWRELGFALEEVRQLLDDAVHDRLAALREQRSRLLTRTERLQHVLAAVDAAIASTKRGTTMDDDEIRALFGGEGVMFASDEYAAEAEERWGGTDAWAQSQERTARWDREQWEDVRDGSRALNARFVALLRDGVSADAPEAVAAAQAHRQELTRFYDVDAEMHRHLADLYVDDERFAAYYERVAPGLARYVHDAIHAASG